MADVTISSLTQGIPAGNNILPYSTGSNTLGVPVSAIFQNTNRVGIGTSSPIYPIEIVDNNLPYIVLRGSNSNALAMYGGTTAIDYSVVHSGVGKDLNISSNGGSPTNGLYIKASGNVGIGTTTPTAKLDVNGTIKASGLQVPGCVVQVVQAYKKDSWGLSSLNNWADVTGLSVSINLKNSNSKILVSGTINLSRDCDAYDVFIRLLRNDALSTGNSTGGTIGHAAAQISKFQANPVTFSYLDSITQTANTYKIQAYLASAACTMFVNTRGYNDGGSFTLTSNLTLMEIAQ